jgi:hypothetical protein
LEVKHFTDGTYVLRDGTAPTPIELTVPFCVGDFSISGLKSSMHEVAVYTARKVLTGLRRGAPMFATGSFTAQMADLTAVTKTSLTDALLKNGAFAAAVSTRGLLADVYTLDIIVTISGTEFGDATDPTFTCHDCDVTLDSFTEGEPNSFAASFICYGGLTGDLAVAI